MIKHEWIYVKIEINTDPDGAAVFDSYGVKMGTTPYTYKREFAKQYWSDGDIAIFEEKRHYTLGKQEKFKGIISKDGYKRQLFEIPYKFEGDNKTIKRTFFLNRLQ